MTDTSKPQNDTNADMPEGFDKPTGPFSGRETPSFADESVNEPSQNDTSNISNDAGLALVADLEQQVADMKEQALRAMAETENMRKRTERERGDMQKYAITSFAKDLLAVSDNLRRALDTVPDDAKQGNEVLENLLVGIEATERQLLKVFEQKGIKKLEPLEEKFDPNFHEVMFEAPNEDYPAGIIFQIIEPGYLLNDRLLRPARVGVSKGAPDVSPENDVTHVDTEA
jgi:molecular chaperone GrpE